MSERDYSKLRASSDQPAMTTRDKQLQDHILDAVRDHEFFICLQPKFALPEKKIVGAEVLLRWNAPEEGIIFPSEFLVAARHAGLIELLDLYAMEDACLSLRKWLDKGMTVVPFSINISSSSLYTPGFVEAMADTVKKHRIPYEYFEFEFSAQFIREYPERLSATITYFHKLGFRCTIDGFAQPAENLAHIRAFEADSLKLNCRSFAPGDSEEGMRACLGVLAAARAEYSFGVCCEGVETPYQLASLVEAGCTLMQGYALSMPVSTRMFVKMLARQ